MPSRRKGVNAHAESGYVGSDAGHGAAISRPRLRPNCGAEVEQEASQFGVVDDSVCSQVYNVGVQQFNAGNQEAAAAAAAGTAEAEEGTVAATTNATANAVNVGNAAGVSVDTGNVCLNNFGGHWWDWWNDWWNWWW